MGQAMPLSLVVFFCLATLGATAALPAESNRKAKANTSIQMDTLSGECIKLVHAGHPVTGCKSILVNMNYDTGVSTYWFMTDHSILSFAGTGSRRAEQGSDIVVQSIERLFLADMGDDGKEDDAKEEEAVGFCRFGDPTRKGMMVECKARTHGGHYEGAFVADGSPPKLDNFQLRR